MIPRFRDSEIPRLRRLLSLFALFPFLLFFLPVSSPANPVLDLAEAQGAFCPGDAAEALILQSLLSAKKSVDVAMFQFTNEKLVQALCFLSAQRHLPIRVFVGPELSSPALVNTLHQLVRSGVQIFITRVPNGKLHLKCAIIDERIVLTGAANWTHQAFEMNIEDVLRIESPELAARYHQRLNGLLEDNGPWSEQGSDVIPLSVRPEIPSMPANGVFRCPVQQASVFFSPANAGASILREQILDATSRVDVAMYLLTYPPLCDAIRGKAAQTNIAVRILVDSEMLASPDILQSLASAGASVFWWGRKQSLLHLKAAVIDGHSVWTGSANWDASAFKLNIEDLLWIESPDLAATYLRYFDWVQKQPDAQPFQIAAAAILLPPDSAPLKPGEFFSSLPPTGPRTDWAIFEKSSQPFQTEASIQYLSDEAYYPVLLDLVKNARQSILISMYVMPDPDASAPLRTELLDALVGAVERRGVYVYLLLNQPSSEGDSCSRDHDLWAERLRARGIDVRLHVPGIPLHEKLVVVDLAKVLLGSHNWTEGSLSGKKVYDSSLLLVLPEQDIRWADYIFSRKTDLTPIFRTFGGRHFLSLVGFHSQGATGSRWSCAAAVGCRRLRCIRR